MAINTEIVQFQQSIVALINLSPLPIEVKRLAVSEVLNNIVEARNQVIQQERQQEQKSEEDSGEPQEPEQEE